MISAAGADAIGLNFFPGSRRYVAPAQAISVARAVPPRVKRVGVFVNMNSESIRRIAEQVGLDYIQLHGDEPPEFLTDLDGLRLIRAFRYRSELDQVRDYLERCLDLPVAVLLDAYDPQAFGGTGRVLEWPRLATAAENLKNLPLILAGGLTPANVARAISEARPAAVDTASGVETATPGRKDRDLTEAFIRAAKLAFAC